MKTIIIYHYLASYRLPIFNELMKSDKIEFTLYSGNTSDIEIKKIETDYSLKKINDGGLRWFFLKNRWFLKNKILWQSGLINLAIKGDYDSVIFLGSPYHISTWFAAIVARLRRKRVFYWMHGVYKDKITFVDYFKLFVFYKIANGFFLYGRRAYNVLNKYKVKPKEDIHIIYNSLDYEKSLEFRKLITEKDICDYRLKYFNDKDTPVIVFIGRLNSIKRLDMIIEAQSYLKLKHNKNFFNTLIIGDGEERQRLEMLVDQNDLRKNVSFLGAIYDEEINSEALMYADLCVTPGEIGLTAIHSLAYGTPVISHDNLNLQMPEVESISRGVNGDLYKYSNLEDLANVIENWLLIKPIKDQSLVSNCYKVIDDYYNPDYQLKIFESVLCNLKIYK
ncbi:glycosyl transferase family 1 [Flavobacterium cheongpyeongense]|uniref:Glycosyl transferase family 1 n=1 Tax=Flavobacterium cheongpyeongense TaxID=2212651 RepID=A0A2V4BU89_9FLAO|nr:glycosyltransferase family 4 protein [Flavobacterium cheongpyeongense]PXY42551.1 glycosyl transferase family 1 [Flavobacterium cheongpyeongense]